MTAPTLSPQVFAILSTLVEERVGLSFAPGDARSFSDKVAAQMVESGFSTPLDYYYALRYDDPSGAHFDALIDALVVGETYFFRESEPLVAAIEHVVKPAVRARGRARVWSAACATGEEPLTIAMLLDRAGLAGEVDLIASDISARAIARASRAVYGNRSMRALLDPALHVGLPHDVVESLVARWFDQREDGWHARRELVDSVERRRINLVDPEAVRAAGAFDLVVCRNVLIYFSDENVRRVVDAIAVNMSTSARLLVGASESLMRFGTLLGCEERGGAFFYGRSGT